MFRTSMCNHSTEIPSIKEVTFDILLIDGDEQRALFTQREIKSSMRIRTAHKASGREAIVSFQRARFDVIICRPHLGDIVCHHWIRMVRSRKFGYALTPVIVLCDAIELHELGPMVDVNTFLIPDADGAALVAALKAIQTGETRHSVLIVEDEVLAAVAAGKSLEKAYRVELAYNGTTAIRLWRESRHTFVLLDLMLPDLPGIEVLRTMMDERPAQIVIVLTAHDAPEQHQELVLAGAVDFLSKPVDMHALPEICASALRARQCMSNVERSRQEAQAASEIAARSRVAHYLIERGQTANGSAHLRRALSASRAQMPDDDQWASLLAEFDVP
jgi:DNA-binding response OmpR family regulator